MYAPKVYKIDLDQAPVERHSAYVRASQRQSESTRARPEKSPARAALLSALIWGSGQIYLGDIRGMYLALLQVACSQALFFAWWFRRQIIAWWRANYGSDLSFIAPIGLFGLLMGAMWFGSVVWAYYAARRSRRHEFHGTDSVVDIIVSLGFVGLGQMLNGQPRKSMSGLLMTALTMAAATCGFLAVIYRPLMQDIVAIAMAEWFLVAAVAATILYVALIPLGIYDAVNRYFYPKGRPTVFMRWQVLKNRAARRGVGALLGEMTKSTCMWCVQLAFLAVLVHAAWLLLPKRDSLSALAYAQTQFQRQHYQVVPGVLQIIRQNLDGLQSSPDLSLAGWHMIDKIAQDDVTRKVLAFANARLHSTEVLSASP